MMPRTAPRKRRATPPPDFDMGPDIRRKRGDVVVGFRPDPDNPNRDVKGGKVRVAYHVLWIEGVLSDEQHEAADRYLVRLEQAEGAKDGSPVKVAGVGGQGYAGPTDRQVMALADLRDADAVLGTDVRLVRQVVGFNLQPSSAEVPILRNALQRLADWWEM